MALVILRFCFVCLMLAVLTSPVPCLSAEDEPKAPAGDIFENWKQLNQRKNEIITQLQKIRREAPQADFEEKKKLEVKFNALLKEFQGDVYPSLIKLAPQILKKQPKNSEAADTLIEEGFHKNRFKEVIQIVETLLKAGGSSQSALNLGGVSYFAIHNFKRAKEMLTRAQKEGELSQLGQNFLEHCEEYQKLWDEEQKIRSAEKKADNLPRVELITTKGRIVVELFENEAPNSVANFINLVEKGFYDGIVFHRVISGFMTQGGCPLTLDENPANDGQGGPGYSIDCECLLPANRNHFQGSLSMAHGPQPNTGGSQFFLTHLPTEHLNGLHTVFGRIIEGMDVNAAMEVGDKIKSAKVLRKRDHAYEVQKN